MKFGNYELENQGHWQEGGKQWTVFFPNGYGASIVWFNGSYGYPRLYELGVAIGTKDEWDLTYSTPVAPSDVLGHLSPEEVGEILDKIKALPMIVDIEE